MVKINVEKILEAQKECRRGYDDFCEKTSKIKEIKYKALQELADKLEEEYAEAVKECEKEHGKLCEKYYDDMADYYDRLKNICEKVYARYYGSAKKLNVHFSVIPVDDFKVKGESIFVKGWLDTRFGRPSKRVIFKLPVDCLNLEDEKILEMSEEKWIFKGYCSEC